MNNVEKLRNYFLGKDPQLKETMSDNSLRLIGIEGKHFVLRTELLKRLIDLKKQVDDKDEELQANIDNVVEALSDEQEARMAGDEALQRADEILAEDFNTKIGNVTEALEREAATREADVEMLQRADENEANTRQTNDNTLQGNIDNEELERVSADADLLNQIRDITNNYQLKFVTILEEDVNLTDGSPAPFTPGLYYSISNTVKVNGSTVVRRGVFFYVESPTQIYTLDMDILTLSKSIYYNQGLGEWMITDREFLLKSQIATTIDEDSSNYYPAGAKAVYDFAQDNYSAEEQRIGTWLDSKPLYRKAFTINSPTASDQYADIDVDLLDIDTLVKMEGLIDTGTEYRQLPIFERVSNYFYFTDLWYSKTDKLLSVRNTNTTLEDKPCNIIIQYTKTTD